MKFTTTTKQATRLTTITLAISAWFCTVGLWPIANGPYSEMDPVVYALDRFMHIVGLVGVVACCFLYGMIWGLKSVAPPGADITIEYVKEQ